jgi:hypothetical protein
MSSPCWRRGAELNLFLLDQSWCTESWWSWIERPFEGAWAFWRAHDFWARQCYDCALCGKARVRAWLTHRGSPSLGPRGVPCLPCPAMGRAIGSWGPSLVSICRSTSHARIRARWQASLAWATLCGGRMHSVPRVFRWPSLGPSLGASCSRPYLARQWSR